MSRRRPHPIMVQLKAERLRQGLSLGDVTDLCGLAKSTVSALETGDRNPTLHTVDVYAAALARSFTLTPQHPEDRS